MNREKIQAMREEVGAYFYSAAGFIIDTQIEWTSEQRGRFDVSCLSDGVTPTVQFNQFADDTVLTITSANGATARLGLKAAAAAISATGMNWVMTKMIEENHPEAAEVAIRYFRALSSRLNSAREFNADERYQIRKYIN